jgi:integrase/recombinase XerC/integrase/recombinase XerD
MKLDKLVSNYLQEVKIRHSQGTWRFYKSHLYHFVNYASERYITDVDEVDDHVISDYIFHMKETCENVTINKNIGCLKRMYRHMNINFPYLQSIDKLKERNKTFDVLDRDMFKKLRRYIVDYPTVTTNGNYHKCFLALLADTGARIQEIMFIEKKNVNLERSEILLTHTKTKEDRVVYLSDNIGIPAVREMMKIKHDHKYLLHNIDKNRPANYDDIRYILRIMKQKFGLKKLHPHMFRHTTATSLVEAGADIASVMQILGHKNIKTTERYLHVSTKHVKKIFLDRINKLDQF